MSEHGKTVPGRRVPLIIGALTFAAIALGALLVSRASGDVNQVALASLPKGVTAVQARAASYRPQRRYVGTIQPWLEARVGPQLISGYVDTVLVRPGDVVRKGQVLATLDCRNASASSKAVAMQARAIQTEQEALAHEAARVAALKDGGFASANEIENREASSAPSRRPARTAHRPTRASGPAWGRRSSSPTPRRCAPTPRSSSPWAASTSCARARGSRTCSRKSYDAGTMTENL